MSQGSRFYLCPTLFSSTLEPLAAGAVWCREAELRDSKGLATPTQTPDRIVFILYLMILEVIFQPEERTVKGAWIVLLGGARACCGHTDSSPTAVWFSGSCLALSFSAGHTKVLPSKPRMSPRLFSRAHQGHSCDCFNPNIGHVCVLMDSVESAPPDFLLCCKILESW